MKAISLYLDELRRRGGCTVAEHPAMRRLCTFRVGGTVAAAVFPEDADTLAFAVRRAAAAGIPLRVIGAGSNILPRDEAWEGVVLVTTKLKKLEKSQEYILADCGTPLNTLVLFCTKCGLAGTECLYGIPGTVGGAVYMNAGAHGTAMADVLTAAEVLDTESGRTHRLSGDEFRFSYRHSLFQEERRLLLLRAAFLLPAGDGRALSETVRRVTRTRLESQPIAYPSAGSVFRRPPEGEVWRMVDRCGLRGFSVGGAQVSEKHAGFIINRGGATAQDVRTVAETVRARVRTVCGVSLSYEIEIW